ncbi:hypothetical protein SUGI_1503600 [Cryptomeria japonica]|uniref:Uncharacterized protein n=1 Tax=Cryptomeria japonica TaxID=3369 RepID=A0AAD3RRU3_CRYJA|nr:hypothetical protein SUGI_1503600 [Cryptomeria japonica]
MSPLQLPVPLSLLPLLLPILQGTLPMKTWNQAAEGNLGLALLFYCCAAFFGVVQPFLVSINKLCLPLLALIPTLMVLNLSEALCFSVHSTYSLKTVRDA